MNIFELKQKPLWQMTGDDLLSLMRHEWEEETAAEESLAAKQAERRRYVYGIRGIAEIFNCSLPTANRIKKSGRIDKAITQVGNNRVAQIGVVGSADVLHQATYALVSESVYFVRD